MLERKVAYISPLFFKLPLGFDGSDEEIRKLISKQLLKKPKKKQGSFDFDTFMKDDDLTMAWHLKILEPSIEVMYKPREEKE